MASFMIPVTIKVTLVFCAAWVVSRTMARRSAAARHLVWTIALMSALTIPAVQAAAPRWNVSVLPSGQRVSTLGTLDATTDQAPPRESAGAPGDVSAPVETTQRVASWPSLLTRLWLVGAGLFLLRLMMGTLWAGVITRRSTPVTDPQWLSMLDSVRGVLDVTAAVRLRYSARTTIPVACGVLRPTVLLPNDAHGWSEERRRVVLLHELAHVKRRDCLVQFAAHAALALHWFNPAAHLAIARLRAEQELACDDVVLASGAGAALYADHLVEIAQAFRRSAFPLWATAAMARPSQLEGRVRAILDLGRNRRSPGRWMCAVAAAGACLLMLPLGTIGLSEAVPPVVAVVEAAAQTPSPAPQPSQTPRQAPPAPPRAPAAVLPQPPQPPQAPAQAPSTSSAISDDTRRRVADALISALGDENVDVRQQALLSLAQMRDPRAIPGFVKALGDSNADVRGVALRALTELATPENAETIAPALIPMLKDPDADVRAQAVRALGQIARARKRSVSPPSPPVPGVGFTPPAPPQVNLRLDSLSEAVERAQAEAEWQIERLWNGR